MTDLKTAITTLLKFVVEHLDIPPSYYEKAASRHRSLGEWLCRPESRVAHLNPHVSPQGSFRHGTVVRPLTPDAEYDLDNVTTLTMPKTAMAQRQIKGLYGQEIKDYGVAHGMLAPIEEKNRCWRLRYADEVNFHLDSLPSVPEDAARIAALVAAGVPPDLASRAVAITDRRHPLYDQITADLLSSNPRGFARWFEQRARQAALPRLRQLVESKSYATVDDVPPYEWKTPLQVSIQLLKRHRDVMFVDTPDLAPISMIITNLAAQAYTGEMDLGAALVSILDKMPDLVRPNRPRVPNPADPAEDYADRWQRDTRLERSFWAWHAQAKADIDALIRALGTGEFGGEVRRTFRVELSETESRTVGKLIPEASIVVAAAPAIHIAGAPRPWGHGE
jgi:hypothetical protein